ncbi:snaclec 3-like [Patiria miniata]|uniref:C-type lectin domain-containing protein n=1 Tax=Patiria miniata TaxID=46514 RepID=A0A913Z4R9_PATMI|nr:snaclec 3-like [Patiria miniata]
MATFKTSSVLFIICFVLSGTTDHGSMVLGCAPCNTGWIEFGNRCHLIVNKQKSFQDAEAYCQGLSRPGRPAHLMSINSEKENDFLMEYAKTINGLVEMSWLWIGYLKSATPKWLDGSQDSYVYWAPGYPLSWPIETIDLVCVGVYIPVGTWVDLYCITETAFVCEMPYRFTTK